MASYKNIVMETQFREGGRSKSSRDRARHDPVPDGSGYHTNKGITWSTFKAWANNLNYTATPKLFYQMPKKTWFAIFKNGYWDKIKANQIQSQAVANLMLTIAFMSGPSRSIKEAQETVNDMGKNIAEDGMIGPITLGAINNLSHTPEKAESFYTQLHNNYLNFLRSIPGRDGWASNGKGWKNRLNALLSQSMKLIKAPAMFFGIAIVLTATYYVLK